jgi:Arc/MetJ-type ribon-helix-helix transcriptional regulator
MTIELKPEQQQIMDLAIQSGAFHDPGEVLDQAFELIREQIDSSDWLIEERDAIAAQIATGFAQAERGELIESDVAIELLRQRRLGRSSPQP